jgi:hypothetical protein
MIETTALAIPTMSRLGQRGTKQDDQNQRRDEPDALSPRTRRGVGFFTTIEPIGHSA